MLCSALLCLHGSFHLHKAKCVRQRLFLWSYLFSLHQMISSLNCGEFAGHKEKRTLQTAMFRLLRMQITYRHHSALLSILFCSGWWSPAHRSRVAVLTVRMDPRETDMFLERPDTCQRSAWRILSACGTSVMCSDFSSPNSCSFWVWIKKSLYIFWLKFKTKRAKIIFEQSEF